MSFKVEFLNGSSSTTDNRPFEFETKAELDNWLTFIRDCPVYDGPVKLRITEVHTTNVRVIKI